MLKDFRDFAIKGNAVDLAIGVVIGAAFGKIVASLVEDIIMPLVGLLTGGVDFSNHFIPLSAKVTAAALADAKKQGAVWAWGNFIQVCFNFLIIALVLFFIVRGLSRLKKEEAAAPPAPPAPSAEQQLLTEIRDLLAKR
ncbi:MAG: large conductance mechanosensitive channel protein MscL [Hyphomicrobiales bacterium]|nr:large conductance mechanosensitive channel protein MscL [Hyphomicrobiales bacterium]